MAAPQYFRLPDFSGGYNPDQHEVLLAENEATDILNFRLDKVGSLVSRQGYAPVDVESAPGSISAVGLWQDLADPNDSVLVVSADETTSHQLYKVVDGEYETLGDFSHSSAPRFVPSQGALYVVGGGGPLLSFDGSEAVAAGVPEQPDTAPTVTDNLGGSLPDEDYTYVYTWVIKGGDLEIESNASPEKAFTGSNDGSLKISTPTPPTGVTHVRIYRKDVTDGSVVFIYLTEVAVASMPYEDDGSDTPNAFIGAPPTDHDIPPDGLTSLAYYNGHYFGASGRMLYWSYPLEPNYWPALNSTELAFEGHDEVVALVSFQDALLIFGHNNLLLLTGQPDGTSAGAWQVIRLDTETGLSSPDAVIEVGGQAVFLAGDGLRVYPGLAPFAEKLSRVLTRLPVATKEAAKLTHVLGERALWLTIDGKTYTIHIPNQAVSIYDLNPAALQQGGMNEVSPPILAIGDRLMQYGLGSVTDNGDDIEVRWTSKVFQLNNPEATKYMRRIGAFATRGGGTSIVVTISDRGNSHPIELTSVDVDADILWDVFKWDESNWPPEGLTYFIGALPAQTLIGQTMQLTITGATDSETEMAPPITILYREANRFLGGA